MENELRIIRHLYDEDERPEEVEALLAEDEALLAEYRSMQAVKQHLDRRKPQHADADVLAQITEAAAEATAEASPEAAAESAETRRSDREPVARQQTRWLPRIGIAGAALVMILAVGVAFWQLPLGSDSESAELAAQESASSPSVTASSAQDASGLPSWDEGDDVARLHQYIQTIQARSSTQQWDSAELPLRPASR